MTHVKLRIALKAVQVELDSKFTSFSGVSSIFLVSLLDAGDIAVNKRDKILVFVELIF